MQSLLVVDSSGSLNISYSVVKNAETGILAEVYANYLNVQYVDFIDCSNSAINILGQYTVGNQLTTPLQIKYSTITNSKYGIQAANLSTIVIQGNVIKDTELGIFLSNVAYPSVIGDSIITSQAVMAGIFLESSGGVVRGNTISGHTNGIHLGNSSPDIGGNTITDNKFHGIYIGAGSLPNMKGRLVGDPPGWYAISGYNNIYENGGWDEPIGPFHNDGSEIYISNANVFMRKGCNSIVDDRLPSPPLVTTILLMNGESSGLPIMVNAEWNYWGADTTYPLSQRFGSLIVDYDPYYSESCPTPQDGGSGGELITRTSSGEPIDTLYPIDRQVGQLTENEILYSKANESFISGDYESAEIYYDQIISSSDIIENKLEAYLSKYEIGKLLERSPEYFNNLQNTYSSLSQSSENELLKKIFKQLSTKSLVGEGQHIPAIGEYDEIIQQNPGSEEAVYAEIDALTTSLLVEGNDSTLGKTAGGRYLIKTSGDYFSKLDAILRQNFGSKKEGSKEEILPKEYTLYQNYPNPFNPTTTIKYDLPKPGKVELVIYDILGRRVKILVDSYQDAGRYESSFNASSLASGVYLYRLSINDYVDVKKMILLK